ncbi:sulfate adenylyltransferase [Candidatus Methylomirabilis lanthanidiphila]|uniref:Sulfate adenylyltransferase n=1 Tax=Candidatus Methylomirabilis lanthanidiphila TaxID=2211376 RepID=A0A564ZMS9_9BACT|nr:sulfate adenylyltransferase [Candidatus Methylomirabilis lanthanidiphila]VUZ86635.1 sulfate adenylyltransferase [Candidatus Methylomirabilis lanthanidiphila]
MGAIPHGGRLIDRVLSGDQQQEALHRASSLPCLELSEEQACQVENLATGVYSPLEGFLTQDALMSVLERMRLPGGLPWTIPIILDVDRRAAAACEEGRDVLLTYQGRAMGLLHLKDAYGYDKPTVCRQVFGTDDGAHPGVRRVLAMGDTLLGGDVDLIEPLDTPFASRHLTPREARVLFTAKGWRTIVGFQTRNVPHLGHEYVQKTALTFVDGLFINPVVGPKKRGDFRDEVILAAYDALLRNYYLKDRAVLAVLKTGMYYAGPREAIFHAIVRKNFGCTHFIVGRDHAGAGHYYSPYAAQEIFDEFPDLGITPLFFTAFFYCRRCQGMANEKTCPHGEQDRLAFSGSKLRDAIVQQTGESALLIRPEVADTIRAVDNPFVTG